MTYSDVLCELHALAEEGYREFSARLVRSGREVLGVRMPALRKLAKRIKKEYPGFAGEFFARSAATHEEVLLCGFQTGKAYEENVRLLSRLIPLTDSWAQTDCVITKFAWAPDKERLVRDFAFLLGGGEFERRAFIILLMTNCMEEGDFRLIEEYLPRVRFGEYYVDMAAAWLLCEAVIHHPERGDALLSAPFVTPSVLSKTRRKIKESYRTGINPCARRALRSDAKSAAFRR